MTLYSGSDQPSRPAEHTGHGKDEVALETSLPCENLAVMRQEVRGLLRGFHEEFVQDVELVCNELVANACDHAEEPRRLRMCRQGHGENDELVIEVHDASADRVPTIGGSTAGRNRGNGLRMVQALSSDWGVRRKGAMKVVWARLPIPSDRAPRKRLTA
ncbi:ATP-binding protein [Saccharothrix longispora]|uniref:Anti-sigma regulatory factor (Ser/Thr protein kinase) n=1 Tax=Saccharothrix longispora TaxID=33920 RepID=A0ABU1PV95_9PSEU|nr:ATP-binding protein [Saccharothrix longispora]MDR6594544.1 anti-sigma regulatory factor (Ser/Thr protein kinase) [Saccharothrix longispora]